MDLITLGLIASFTHDLSAFARSDELAGEAKLGNFLPGSPAASQDPVADTVNCRIQADPARFAADLDRLSSQLSERGALAPTLPTSETSSKLTFEEFLQLATSLNLTMDKIKCRAHSVRQKAIADWPNDPRVCSSSIFQPLAVRRREVPLTQSLAWVMTPRVGDGLSVALLARLVSRLVGIDSEVVSLDEFHQWSVAAEKQTENDAGERGRIDIYLEGQVKGIAHSIAIEAKVDANESEGQLAKYSATQTVFLTIDGRVSRTMPSARSISYAELLELWLPVLRANEDSEHSSFTRLLFADIARDLAKTHLGNHQIHGIPRGLDLKP